MWLMGMDIGPLHVRRSAYIRAAPARVWKEFETSEAICAWLDRGHRIHTFEPRVGGTVDMSVEKGGLEREHFGGPVLVVEPERELSFESAWKGSRKRAESSFWTFRLTPVYEGTLVELFHHGFERMGHAAADQLEGFEGGWDTKHLTALRAIAES